MRNFNNHVPVLNVMNDQHTGIVDKQNMKSPWLAVLLSKIFPGAGHIYSGEKPRGILYIALTIVLYLALVLSICGFLLIENAANARFMAVIAFAAIFFLLIVSIYVLFDAYKITKRNNPVDAQPAVSKDYRKAWLAAFLSSLFPGIGQFYNGQILKGAGFVAAMIALVITEDTFTPLIIAGLFVYIYGIKDAYDSAETMNGSGNRFFHQNRTIVLFMMVMFALQSIPFSKIIKENVVEAFKIASGSMIPTMTLGDSLLLGKLRSFTSPLKRGDVVVFPYPVNPEKNFVKRVIGLGGDRVQFINGELYVNEQLVSSRLIGERSGEGIRISGQFGPAIEFEEQIGDAKYHVQYLRDKTARNEGHWLIPEDSVFVLGDNRDSSQDSRIWGPVKKDGIKGKAMKIYWSWDRAATKVRWERIGQIIH